MYNSKHGAVVFSPMMPKIPKMLGANITSMLMKLSRMIAMATWRSQLNALVGNSICWMALRTCGHTQVQQGHVVIFLSLFRSIAPNKPSTNSQGRARWGRSALQRWGRPLARTGSTCHTGRSGCKCAAVRAPLCLDKYIERFIWGPMLLKSSVLSSRWEPEETVIRDKEERKKQKAITFLLHSNTTRGAKVWNQWKVEQANKIHWNWCKS